MTYIPYRDPNSIVMLAGPCAVESLEQTQEVAVMLKEQGLRWIRGGAFKPRTSRYSFQGLGEQGLAILQQVGAEQGLKTITEVIDTPHAEMVHSYVDALQIGARNMTSYSLLKKVSAITGESHKPVLFKRGMAATIDEWLMAADYVTADGNPYVMLCERGLRTFETSTRYTLDISAVPVVHQRSLFPVCVDVSHPAGQASLVPDLARAAIAAGADALMIEVHPNPKQAKSDGPQQLTCQQFVDLLASLRHLAAAMGKTII
ncbi:MAG: 3-deoxy-7-phosphoheptulonate synthase [Coriobacteriales bacterium]|nr:3-deoxy-7-phosphoheptulonate synthase [Coriobacteriales bacterium]MBQ6585961.1 3-deoxy-7-phosphoheptulonate synthase [Coriobacteriales bacterium]